MSYQFEYDVFIFVFFGMILGALYVVNDVPNENNIYLWDGLD